MEKIKLLLVIALLGMVSFVGAQNLSFNVKGGLNLSNVYGDNLSDNKMKPGYHIGVGGEFELSPNIFLQSGLLFTTKGYKYKSEKTSANYLQLPIHAAYKIDATPGTRVVLHAGPYIAYGVGGKILGNVNTFDKDLGFKPFDAGVGLGVGAEFGNILVDLGWDMGLVNISRASLGSIKTQNAHLSVGYKF